MELEAFKIKVAPLRKKLLNISLNIVKKEADAEDIVQEAFLKLWYLRDKLDAYRSVEAFAVMLTKNLALDKLKLQKPQANEDDLHTLNSKDGNPEERLVQQDAVNCVRMLISQLPSLQQTIIRMKDIEGYEVEEIAGITGCQTEAIRVNLSRARKKIRERFIALNKEVYEYR
ncbi:MAG: sigma-70 family RNA polymerase sigma factor [Tannerellaceae bacterium]|jgi:RNA polymerase sigma-70 factor (ECF subfamily)|nr:sigma-70 family RNA polymerase sigma factor [Tannerellaceae bacterium]